MLFSFAPTFVHKLLGKVSMNKVIIILHERERLGNDVVFIWSHIPLREKLWAGITFLVCIITFLCQFRHFYSHPFIGFTFDENKEAILQY
jgi:hypothetical protein